MTHFIREAEMPYHVGTQVGCSRGDQSQPGGGGPKGACRSESLLCPPGKRGKSSALSSLSNASRLWAVGVTPSCLGPSHALIQGRQNIDLKSESSIQNCGLCVDSGMTGMHVEGVFLFCEAVYYIEELLKPGWRSVFSDSQAPEDVKTL